MSISYPDAKRESDRLIAMCQGTSRILAPFTRIPRPVLARMVDEHVHFLRQATKRLQ